MTTSDLRTRYGEWAMVTGASSGIGATFAQKLAGARMNLVLVARRIELLNELSRELAGEHGVTLRCVQVDLSKDGCLEPLIGACRDLDVGLVVNNAGSGIPGLFSSSDVQSEKALIRLNCVTPVEITRHFLPGMQANRRGGIILVSSLMGFQGVPYMANYSATKGYLLNASRLAFTSYSGQLAVWTDPDGAFVRDAHMVWFARASVIREEVTPSKRGPIAKVLLFRLIRHKSIGLEVSYLYPLLLAGLVIAAIKPPPRLAFSLRGLLITLTLFAVALACIDIVARARLVEVA